MMAHSPLCCVHLIHPSVRAPAPAPAPATAAGPWAAVPGARGQLRPGQGRGPAGGRVLAALPPGACSARAVQAAHRQTTPPGVDLLGGRLATPPHALVGGGGGGSCAAPARGGSAPSESIARCGAGGGGGAGVSRPRPHCELRGRLRHGMPAPAASRTAPSPHVPRAALAVSAGLPRPSCLHLPLHVRHCRARTLPKAPLPVGHCPLPLPSLHLLDRCFAPPASPPHTPPAPPPPPHPPSCGGRPWSTASCLGSGASWTDLPVRPSAGTGVEGWGWASRAGWAAAQHAGPHGLRPNTLAPYGIGTWLAADTAGRHVRAMGLHGHGADVLHCREAAREHAHVQAGRPVTIARAAAAEPLP